MMNYVAFTGVSKLDNLYVEATNKMKAVKVILECTGAEKAKINKALEFEKEIVRELPFPSFWSRIRYKKSCFVRFVIVWYEIMRVIYKGFYFYLFPYMVVPVSYYMYDIFKVDRIKQNHANNYGRMMF